MRGYSNFHAGVSIGLVVFGYYLKHRDSWQSSSSVLFNLLVLLHYFTHPVALAATGLLLAAYEFARTQSPARVVGIVIRGYIPSLVLLTGFLYWSSRYGAWVDPHVKFLTISDKIQNVFFRGATPLSVFANLTSLALLGAVAVIAGIGVLRTYGEFSFRKIYVNPRLLVREPMVVVFSAAVLLYLLMPWDLVGWHKAGVRILPMIFMLVLALPRSMPRRWQQAAFAGVASAVAVAGLVAISGTLRRGSDEVAEYVAGIDAVPPRSRMLPVFPETERSDTWRLSYAIDPLHRADAYYCMARGGASGNSLARNNTLYWVWYKDYRQLAGFPKLNMTAPAPEEIEAVVGAYDTILVWDGRQRFRELFLTRGFSTAFEQGRLTILTRVNDDVRKVSLR